MPNKEGRSIAPREEAAIVVSVRMPRPLYEEVNELAAADQRSVSWMARRLIEEGVEAHRERER